MTLSPLSKTVETRSLVRWGPVGAAAGLLLVLVLTVFVSFLQAVDDRGERLTTAARMAEQSVTRTFESVETTLLSVASELQPPQGQDEIDLVLARKRMADAIRFAPHIRQLMIVRGSKVLADTNGQSGKTLDMDRLNLYAKGESYLNQGLRIGDHVEGRYLPLAEAPDRSPRSILPVALPVDNRSGKTPLLIVAALNNEYIDAIFRPMLIGRHGQYGLMRQDGQTLLGNGDQTFDKQRGPLRRMVHTGDDDEYIVEMRQGIPQAATALHLSARYPLAVVLTLSHRDTLAEWADRNRAILSFLGLLTVAGIFVLAALLHHALQRRTLSEQVRLLVQAIEQSPVVVLITDAHGQIAYVNPSFSRLFGYSFDEALGKNPKLLSSGLTPVETYQSLWATIGQGQSWTGEFLNRAKDGTIVNVSSTISSVQGSRGEDAHFIGVMADITEQKRFERERERLILKLARANEDLHRFAEISAHHLQEPARRLVSFAQRIRTRLEGRFADEETVLSLNFIEQQASRLRNLLRDIQLYLAADVPLGSSTLSDTGKIVRTVISRLEPAIAEAGAVVTVSDMPEISIDSPRLRDLFDILLDNALRYRRADRNLVIAVSGQTSGSKIRFQVADNGTGIDPEFRERVFKVFERLPWSGEVQGTGIGLAIVRRIAESNNGTVWIEETPGGGATVILEFENTPHHD